MKKTMTILIASTALSAILGLPAWSDGRSDSDDQPRMHVSEDRESLFSRFLHFVSDDDDDHDSDHDRGRGHDDDDDDDDDDDCDDDDCGTRSQNAAPVGTVAPPANGLIGTGTPPQVRLN